MSHIESIIDYLKSFGMARRTLLMVGLVLPIAACSGVAALQKAAEPLDAYELTPKSTFDPSLPYIDTQVVIEEPTAVSGLNSDRIAVKPNPYQLQYFPGVRWVDRAPVMVQSLMIQTLENTGKVASVERRAIGLSSDIAIRSDLREFQAESAPTDDNPDNFKLRVRLNLKLVESRSGRIIASKSFQMERDVPSDDRIEFASAFDEALGKVLKKAAEWAIVEIDRQLEDGDG